MNERIAPLERIPTSALIAERLREAIMSGSLHQGQQVGESQLAARFGVSRGPLREAMQRLVQEGLLNSIPHRGLFVVELSDADIRDIYTARLAIEGGALLQVMMKDDRESSAKRLDKSVTKLQAAAASGDASRLSACDMAFHELLVAESGSARLIRMSSTLLVETRMCMHALTDKYVAPADLADEHAAIVDVIRSGDRARGLEIIRTHMEDAVGRLVD